MATTNPDFSAILDRQSSDIERPKALPIGDYLWNVKGLPRFDKSSQKGTPFVEFTCQPMQALDNVDEDDLVTTLAKKDGSKRLLADMAQRLTFYLTDDALWRLKKFLIKDLQLEEEDKTISALIDEAAGCQFIGTLKHEPTRDGEGVYAQIANTAPTE